MKNLKQTTLDNDQLRIISEMINFDGAEMGFRGRFQRSAMQSEVREHYNAFIQMLNDPGDTSVERTAALDQLTLSIYRRAGRARVHLASDFGAEINWQTIGGAPATESSISEFETKLRAIRAHSGYYFSGPAGEFVYDGDGNNSWVNANPSAETVAAVDEVFAAIRTELGQKLESQFKYYSLTERFSSVTDDGEVVVDHAGLQREVLAGIADRGDQGVGELLALNRTGKKHDQDFQWIGRDELLSAVREIQNSPDGAERLQALGLSSDGGDEFSSELLAAAAAGGAAAIDAGAQPAPTVNPLVSAAVLKFHLSSIQGGFGDELQVQPQSVTAVAALGGVSQQAERLEA